MCDILNKSEYTYKKGGVTVLNEKKLQIMSRLASYEKKEHQKDFKRAKYYKSDYIRYNLLKTIVSVTIGYVLILGLIAFYNLEFLISNAVILDYNEMIGKALTIYILLLVIYIVGTIIIYSLKYDKSHRLVGKYYKMLGVLRRFYHDEAEQK